MTTLIRPTRRGFLLGLSALIAAPALVRVSSLMPVSSRNLSILPPGWYVAHTDTYDYGRAFCVTFTDGKQRFGVKCIPGEVPFGPPRLTREMERLAAYYIDAGGL